jgi:hypothetical protein
VAISHMMANHSFQTDRLEATVELCVGLPQRKGRVKFAPVRIVRVGTKLIALA